MNRKNFFGITLLAVATAVAVGGLSVAVRSTGKASDVKEVSAADSTTYDCATLTRAAFADSYDGICWASGCPFGSEALNLTEFFVTGQGINEADANGTLPNDDEGWTASTLSLLTYPMYSNASLGSKFNQYPLGWRMNTAENVGVADAWPDGKVSASMSYGAFDVTGWIHPDSGFGTVIYFVAPSAGTVYITDTVSAPNSPDGTYFCTYKIPAASWVTRSWNSQTHHGLCGGTPIYPSAGVSPTSNWGTGWKHISTTAETYYTENFTVAAGDVIAWIYGAGPATASDATYTSPKVVYGTSPVDEAASFAETYIHSPNGETIAYDNYSDTGACRGSSGYYVAAKTAYDALSSEAKSIFKSYDQFADARARLSAWATANGETIDISSSKFAFVANTVTSDNTLITVLVIVGALALVIGTGALVFRRKER